MFKSNQFKIVLCACRNSYSPANRFLDKNCLRICDSSYVVHKSNFVKSISQIVMASGSGTPVSSSNGSGGSKAIHSVGHSVNRLAKEKSPYLLQHATNPVDWYPWGEEAIQKAKNENKLIFLSVGYSTCHWCHVMEKESFEDPTVARILNENYVSIKVDREERPDIDKIYMTFVLMINGSGGWPMSVWMTPDLVPITAGTYYPPTDRWGMPGFKTILMKIAEKWTEKGDELKEMGPNVIAALQRSVNERDEDAELTSVEKKFDQAVQIYKRNFDEEWGGWGKQPKFPEVSKLNFLLHAHFKKSGEKIADMVLHTLVKMANGGIHDHVFGGFARYSVDKRWHIPHFEKMLYDQGQLLVAYSNAYRMTHNEFFIEVADKILHYLMKDLQHPLGGFFSGEDADSLPHHDDRVKIEGAFYAWNYQEVCDAFESNAERFDVVELADSLKPFDVYAHHYDIQEDGNVEPSSDPHGHLLNKNILFVDKSIEDTAKKFNVPTTIIKQLLSIGNEILYEIRCKRPRPHLDTKIICAWNGLTLSGISKLAQISDLEHRGKYLTVAKKLLEFIRKYLYDEQEKTLHRACYGEGVDSEVVSNTDQPIQGFLDDYAFLIKGLLDYYVATHDIKALEWAVDLQKTQDKLFWDEENGGYFYTQADTANVIVRLKEDHDGAEPCGNSMAVHNLMLLNTYYEDAHFKERAKRVLDSFEHITPFGYSLPHMLSGLLLFDNGIQMLVIVGPDNDASHEMFKVVSNFFVPGLVPIQIKIERPHETTRKSATQFKMLRNLPTAYLCHNQICQLPITEPTEMKNLLTEKYVYSYDQI